MLEYHAKEKVTNNILGSLDNDLFQDSSDEEDNNLNYASDSDASDNELDNYNEKLLIGN